MAQLRVIEYLAAEVPDAFIASVHPGIVETDLMRSWDPDAAKNGPRDSSHSALMDDGQYAGFSDRSSRCYTRLYDLYSVITCGLCCCTNGFHSQTTGAFHPLDHEP